MHYSLSQKTLTKHYSLSQETYTKKLLRQKQIESIGLPLIKKIFAEAVFILVLLFSLIVAVQPADVVYADPIPGPPINTGYILSNGTVDPSTLPIVRDGNVYTLTGDISNYSMIVQCDNIVIDGAGHSVRGYGTYWYDGIDISNRTNITIKNVDISPFGFGVRMDYGSNNTVIGTTMSAFTGVSLLYSDNNQIIGNTIANGYGVAGPGSNNLIIGNNFTSGLSAAATVWAST